MFSKGPVQDWNGLLEELMISINLFPFVTVLKAFLNFHDKHKVCSVSKKKKKKQLLSSLRLSFSYLSTNSIL